MYLALVLGISSAYGMIYKMNNATNYPSQPLLNLYCEIVRG